MATTSVDIIRAVSVDPAVGEELLNDLGFDGTEASIEEATSKEWISQDDNGVYRVTDAGLNALAADLLSTSDHMVLATSDLEGIPWVSPVFFVRGEADSLLWVSSKTARHSQNIREQPRVALTVYSTGPAVGLYLEAKAAELADPAEIALAIRYYGQKTQPTKFTVSGPEDVTEEAVWRIYVARPTGAWRRADGKEAGQAVTIRREIDIPTRD